jgi:hypothetical protein
MMDGLVGLRGVLEERVAELNYQVMRIEPFLVQDDDHEELSTQGRQVSSLIVLVLHQAKLQEFRNSQQLLIAQSVEHLVEVSVIESD